MRPKYRIGQIVRAARHPDFDFTGAILEGDDTGVGWEYRISNAPLLFPGLPYKLLVWESEITPVVKRTHQRDNH